MSEKRKEFLLDLKEDNVNDLSEFIITCIRNEINLICFSKDSVDHPDKSITEISGLPDLFTKACLEHGLLGYLDWKNETAPSEQNTSIINNVIIATCGGVSFNEGVEGIVHDINMEKLDYIRARSRKRFDALLSACR